MFFYRDSQVDRLETSTFLPVNQNLCFNHSFFLPLCVRLVASKICWIDIMKASVTWGGDARFVANSGSGHEVIMDGPPDHGGKNAGPRPMEMLLLGLGGCTTFDVMSILLKSRQDVTDCRAEIEAERVDDVPAVFKKIHIHFVVEGNGLKEAIVKRAVSLSAEKYCSASIMLEKGGVEITHSFEIK